jgi:hypothetical protein
MSHLRRQWLLANFLAFAIGGAFWGGVLRTLGQPYYGQMITALEAAYVQSSISAVSGAIFGAIVGVAQWLVLRQTIRARWWALGTCAGWGLAGVVMGFNAGGSVSTIGPDAGPLHPLFTFLLFPPLAVFLLGAAQWLILRREFAGAQWWLAANGGGLLVGLVVGLVVAMLVPWLAPTDFPSAQANGIVGAIAGPIYGLVTWTFLSELRRRDIPTRNALPTLP